MTKFTQINVDHTTKRKIKILAPILQIKISELITRWVNAAWVEAVAAGKVTEAALEAQSPKNGERE